MARVILFPQSATSRFFYNLDNAVGLGSANVRDDVLLVQYFLKTIFDNPSASSKPLSPLPLKPGEVFRVDGIAGPITVRAIKHYQETQRAGGRAIVSDGRVDKAKAGSGVTTILFLNTDYKTVRPNDFNSIAFAADCPQDLKKSFSLF